MAGQVPGSDFYVAGGITELNFNIRSNGVNAAGGGGTNADAVGQIGGSTYVMNIGLDMRLVNTRTLEVVDVISYQKQIVAHQIGVGVFSIWNGNAVSVAAGEGGHEPLQLARPLGDRARRGRDGGQPLRHARSRSLHALRPAGRDRHHRRHRRLHPGLRQPEDQQRRDPRRSIPLGRAAAAIRRRRR